MELLSYMSQIILKVKQNCSKQKPVEEMKCSFNLAQLN